MKKRTLEIHFVSIDDWNRPVFKIKDKEVYLGSLEILFKWGTSEEEVLSKVSADDLVYFGSSFDGDPWGTPIKEEITLKIVPKP